MNESAIRRISGPAPQPKIKSVSHDFMENETPQGALLSVSARGGADNFCDFGSRAHVKWP